jgi:UDP-GlcNAc:undecaprenyl-phosphate GlcNAc-1-phosphate transferase
MDSQPLILAFLATAASVSILRPLAKALGWVDKPGGRKHHVKITPIIGGPAMLLGFFAGGVWLLEGYEGTVIAACLMFTVGLFDDRFDLSARFKLLTQIGAACAIVFIDGLVVRDLGNLLGLGTLPLGAFAIPLTLLAIVGFLNAVNMADGADGVAGTIGLVLAASLLAIAKLAGITPPPALPLLAVCLLAFLLYNFPFREERRAKLFMGDSGALMVGAVLAGSALQMVADHRSDAAPIPPMLIAALLAPPVFDCLLLMGRRLSKGRSPMSPDRDHLHHIFERAGLGKRSTVLAIAAYLTLNAVLALGLWQLGLPEFTLTALFLAAFALQARFMLHAWQSAKWLKGKAPAPTAENTATIVELDRTGS